MASIISSVDTLHEDMIHDAQLDFYGKRLATCSSDRTVRIFEVSGDHQSLIQELKGHDGPVWQVAWAFPRFGSILASCSWDGKVIVWKESGSGWENIHEHKVHESSINAIAWAPSEAEELALACGSSDGDISILRFRDGEWQSEKIKPAHSGGVYSVSWAPLLPSPSGPLSLQLASGGNDSMIKIWTYRDGKWDAAAEEVRDGEKSHKDWVRDVAFAPALPTSSSASLLASVSNDGEVCVWTKDKASNAWARRLLHTCSGAAWRCSWSVTGAILAVSAADNKVSLWKENLKGEWIRIGDVDEQGASSS